jgi:hypothetical protein
MGEAAKAWVGSRFNAQGMVDKIGGLYEGLLHAKQNL